MHEKVQTQHVARETAHSGWFCISAPTGDTWRLLMKRTNGQKKKKMQQQTKHNEIRLSYFRVACKLCMGKTVAVSTRIQQSFLKKELKKNSILKINAATYTD